MIKLLRYLKLWWDDYWFRCSICGDVDRFPENELICWKCKPYNNFVKG